VKKGRKCVKKKVSDIFLTFVGTFAL